MRVWGAAGQLALPLTPEDRVGLVKPCLLIPDYDHKDTIQGVLQGLAGLGLPCLVVDDGSGPATREVLAALPREFPWVEVERLPVNRGRGAALAHGYRTAARRGFSHVVQLDADGQHDPADVPRFLAVARQRPDALVLGAPVFDRTAPWIRLYGRRLSQLFVRGATLSRAIQDPLCGFRCFPLEPTVRLLDRVSLGDRMEFDPAIVVRLVWEGVPVLNVPTRVRYLAHGISHFRLVRDNLLIARAYAGLSLALLARLSPIANRSRQAVR